MLLKQNTFFLADIDKLYIKYDNLKDVIITYIKKLLVVRRFSYLFFL